jgi:predicted TIM-barrel enzyme
MSYLWVMTIPIKSKTILGMIHLSGGDIVQRAINEIDIYAEEGLDGCIIENYHGSTEDVEEVLIALSTIPKKNIKIGINILPNNFEEAFRIANKFKVDFIQLDYIAGKYVGDKMLDVENYIKEQFKYEHRPLVLGGVWPKYYEPIKGSDLKSDIEEGLFLGDGIVVTGSGTGKETPIDKIKLFREHMNVNGNRYVLGKNIPLIIGAGVDVSNVAEQLLIADGAIVGSCFKPYKRTQEMVKRELVREFMGEVKKIK